MHFGGWLAVRFARYLQFIVFPTTADCYWLNRLSLGLVLALVVIANIKFLLISGLTWR